ncbi:winged helix-turn-helix transcriptional regulator [Aggregatimonas sangjinii]|uniref:Winged helix-turn-helix transcriptional regulator n=1 Tax=Aggregatimonas sangjinii TaxID=2583587 RepID=A0A5B7SP00_9FLAO|nr:SatD family protein [Aggregatimonas sangjinii]QCX00316.1 winged helix-turn-helix transcriptional regulator [Aggregatimonas sangjinii]
MEAIITGDIVNSEQQPDANWLTTLKRYLSSLGESPTVWEVYRGDEFQLKVPLSDALETAIHIKATMKSTKGLDVRMGIGLGEITFVGSGVSESNGPAYRRSGRAFESLKEDKSKLTIATGDDLYDDTLNLVLKLALDFMNDWSTVSAEIVALALENPEASQNEIAKRLGIQQSAVSQRQKRARLDLVFDLLTYYSKISKDLAS